MKKNKTEDKEILNKIFSNPRVASTILGSIKLPESVLEEWLEYFSILQVFRYQKVSEQFIEKFEQILDLETWKYISEKPEYLNKQFILKYIDRLDLNDVFCHTEVWFPELVKEYVTFAQKDELKSYNEKLFTSLYLEYRDEFQNLEKEKIFSLMVESFNNSTNISSICQTMDNKEFKEFLNFWVENKNYIFERYVKHYHDSIPSDKQQILKDFLFEHKKHIEVLFVYIFAQNDISMIERDLDKCIEQGFKIQYDIFKYVDCDIFDFNFLQKYDFSIRSKLYFTLNKKFTLEEIEQNIALLAPYWRFGILRNEKIADSLSSKIKNTYRNYIKQNNIQQIR